VSPLFRGFYASAPSDLRCSSWLLEAEYFLKHKAVVRPELTSAYMYWTEDVYVCIAH